MSCGYGTDGFQCNVIYTLGGTVTATRAAQIYNFGKELGLTEFNPTSVNWDAPIQWRAGGNSSAIGSKTGGIMTEAEGFGMMIGFGIGLTALTVVLTLLEQKFAGGDTSSEQFNTAGRSVKTGLTGSVIVSQWTWAATLLQSSNVAWNYGITGPFWYAAGATVQILLFGILAIEVKRRAPNAHTFLEIVKVRWGTAAHFVFLFFGLSANLIVSAMLLLGGCAVYDAVAGISVYASSFIIPLLTLVYTLVGGLKATFLAGYVHTSVIMVILILMVSTVYGYEFPCENTDLECVSLGSASLMYERLKFMVSLPTRNGECAPEPDTGCCAGAAGCSYLSNDTYVGFHQGPAVLGGKPNRQGSYLTIMSLDGLSFGIINIIGNFGTVFVDQSYWQSAIAAKPGAAHKGYILGGMVWFTIPFALATALGLAGNALNVDLTSGDAGSGLVPPASAIAMFGKAGGILIMTQLTMAILSTGSAECIAVSSLFSYDIYRTYINPAATGKQILNVSRVFVILWAVVMSIASIVLYETGLNLGWVYNFMAIALGSAVVPIACSIYTDKLDGIFAMLAAAIGMGSAIVTWMITASQLDTNPSGEISVDSLGQLYAQLGGGLAAIMMSLLVCCIGMLIKPMHFDWNIMYTGIELVAGDGGENQKVLGADDPDATPEALVKAKEWIFKYGWGYTMFLCVVWPLLAVPFGAFGKSVFQLWAAVALMWGWVAGLIIILMPIYESWDGILSVLKMDTSGGAAKTAMPTASSSSTALTASSSSTASASAKTASSSSMASV